MNQTSVEKRISRLVRELGELLPERGETLALAESCTGGWVGQAITSRPGSSRWFSAGFVTYSNDAKQRLLGVRSRTLIDHGAVSAEAARQMAEGALRRAGADWSLAVTGIAGPGGGAKAKPVGTVWFAWVGSDLPSESESRRFDGDRRAVRAQSVEFALKGLLKRLTRGGGVLV